MKIAVIIVRVLLGAMFIFAAVMVLFHLGPEPKLEGKQKEYMDGMMASGYFIYLLKITELVCGLLFVTGQFVPLANVMIFPITLNILFYHAFLDPSGLPVAIALIAANLFLAFACRKHYVALLSRRIVVS